MGFIAIVGSGALGGAVAHALAVRDRLPEVRLIDPAGQVARGKALDIQQSSPISGFSTTLTAAESVEAAVGADVVVVADDATGSVEHTGDAGLGLLRHLVRAGSRAPILCAGASQRELIARAVTELRLSRGLVLGSAPFALESALRALAGLTLDGSGAEVCLRVVGVPPRAAVVAWEEATAYGEPLASQMAPHAIAGLAARIPGLWPPGPVRACLSRRARRRSHRARVAASVFVLRGDRGRPCASRRRVDARRAGRAGIERVLEPALTRQERTALENALEKV